MESKWNTLRESMDSTTHKGTHFSEQQKQEIWKKIRSDNSRMNNQPKKFVMFAITTVAAAIFLLLLSIEFIGVNESPPGMGDGSLVVADEWEVRHEYSEDGEVLFRVFPDNGLTAGKTYGYLFSFTEDFDVFEGKSLAIYAQHKETGQRINVLFGKRITEPSHGYQSLERFTPFLAVPYGGLWKYEVFVNGELYGDVVLSVYEKQEGTLFLPEGIPNYVQEPDFEQIDWERKAVEFGWNMLGNENKTGVIGAQMPSLSEQKWMWHIWGERGRELTVVGYHRETESVHQILKNSWSIGLGGENNDADAHTPSSVIVPIKGEWAILLYVDGELFDILVYDIEE